MTNLNQHTVSLIGNMRNLDSNLEELIRKFNSLDNTFENTEKTLLISKKFNNEQEELFKVLTKAEIDLSEMLNISYVGAIAKVSHKSIIKIKEEVNQSKTKANELEAIIKSHREKLMKFRVYIEKTIKALITIEKFIKKEGQLVDKTHKMNIQLPESRYKNLSQERLNNSSKLQINLLTVPNKVVDKINGLIPRIELNTSEIEKLCEIVDKVFEPIKKIDTEINRIIEIKDKINEALKKVLSVSYSGGKTTLPIKKITSQKVVTTGINSLTESAVDILEPLLKELLLNTDKIKGIDSCLENLVEIVNKLKNIEQDRKEIKKSISAFIDKNNPQKTFDQVNEQEG